MAITTTTGTRAATAPLTLMRAVTSAHTTMSETDHAECAASPARCHELLSDPGRHPGGVEGFAHHEQRGDVDDGRVTEAAERLVEVEHAGGPERQRDAPKATTATGIRFQTNRTTAPPRIEERDGALGHQRRRPIRGHRPPRAAGVVQSESTERAEKRTRGRRRRRDRPRSRPRRRPRARPRTPGRTRPPAPRRRGCRARRATDLVGSGPEVVMCPPCQIVAG